MMRSSLSCALYPVSGFRYPLSGFAFSLRCPQDITRHRKRLTVDLEMNTIGKISSAIALTFRQTLGDRAPVAADHLVPRQLIVCAGAVACAEAQEATGWVVLRHEIDYKTAVAHFVVNANHGVPIRLAKLARFFQNSAQYENDNSPIKKFNEPLAFARVPSHPADPRPRL